VTVTAQDPAIQYVGDGIQDTFSFSFRILQNSDLRVFVDDVEKVEISDYTIDNLTVAGGDVVFIVPPPDQSSVSILRATAKTQQIDLEPFTEFPANTMELGYDKLTMITQELESRFILDVQPQVFSFNTRIGHIIPDVTDYDQFYLKPSEIIGGQQITITPSGSTVIVATDPLLATKAEFDAHTHDHDNLTNVTANQHHNQAHLLYGPDHTDVADSGPPEIGDMLEWDGGNWVRGRRMNWNGVWAQGTYHQGDVVLDGIYTMIANKTTTDRAAPQNSGAASWVLPDTPVWTDQAQSAVVWSGHTYTFNTYGYLQGVRIWVPVLSGVTNYRTVLLSNGAYRTIEEPVLNQDAWTVLSVGSTLVSPGDVLLVYLDSLNSGSDTTIVGGWVRGANSNTLEPANQNWNHSNNNDTVRIDFDDLDSIGRQTELESIVAGSSLSFVENGFPDRNVSYRVLSVTTGTTSVIYSVVLLDTGPAGEPLVGADCNFTGTVPVPSPTDYVELPADGTEPTWAAVEGFLAFDEVNQNVPVTNRYGVDINFQPISLSPDWDVVSLS
jgi:hypothetical protein